MAAKTPTVCALLFATIASAGCGSAWPQVIDPTDIVTLREGTPHIRRIVDIGSPHIGAAGPLQPMSDGQVVVGEQLLIEGSGFGKQPTVLIAGRAADVRWRTSGGGLIVQVPSGGPAGAQSVVVEASGKSAESPLLIHRLAVVLDGQRRLLHALRVLGGSGQQLTVEPFGKPVPVGRALGLSLSSDGAAAYVLVSEGDREQVAIVDLTASGGPSLKEKRPLRHRAKAIVSASAARTIAIVGDRELTLWDVGEACHPTAWPAASLPAEASAATTFALSPKGTLLAAGFATTNEVALIDVRPSRTEVTPKEAGRTVVLPLARQPLLHSVRFSSEGDLLWTLSGEKQASAAAQATQLVAVTVGEKEPNGLKRELSLGKPIDVRDAGSPLSLSVARSQPIASGATIRTVPERSQVVFATAPRSEGSHPLPGSLFRVGAGGALKTLLSGSQLFASVDLSPDAGLAITAEQPASGALTVTVADTEVQSTVSLTLGTAPPSDKEAPVEVLVQP
jgi:hypothetical protein